MIISPTLCISAAALSESHLVSEREKVGINNLPLQQQAFSPILLLLSHSQKVKYCVSTFHFANKQQNNILEKFREILHYTLRRTRS